MELKVWGRENDNQYLVEKYMKFESESLFSYKILFKSNEKKKEDFKVKQYIK